MEQDVGVVGLVQLEGGKDVAESLRGSYHLCAWNLRITASLDSRHRHCSHPIRPRFGLPKNGDLTVSESVCRIPAFITRKRLRGRFTAGSGSGSDFGRVFAQCEMQIERILSKPTFGRGLLSLL